MKTGKHSHTWLSALSGIIAGQGEVSHEYKIQNGNMIHEEPLRGYRACINDPKIPLAAGLHCKSGRKMGRGDRNVLWNITNGENILHTTQRHTTYYIHASYILHNCCFSCLQGFCGLRQPRFSYTLLMV